METITINVNDYYGNPSYYSVMPDAIFDALELAFLKNEKTATVSRSDYECMMNGYAKKMKR